MSIFGPVPTYDHLTPEQREVAWKLAYRTSLDELPDREVLWEAQFWYDQGLHGLAVMGDLLLAGRRAAGVSLPGGADATSLHRLLSRVNVRAVMRLVEDEGLCLVSAIRLVYWNGLAEVPR